jgi:hypothetical protein
LPGAHTSKLALLKTASPFRKREKAVAARKRYIKSKSAGGRPIWYAHKSQFAQHHQYLFYREYISGDGAAGGHAAVRQTRTINLDARSRDACRSHRRRRVPKHQGRPVRAAQSPRKRARAPAIGRRWCSKRHQQQLSA